MKTSIAKIILTAIIISVFVIIRIANAEVTKSDAQDLVLNQILKDDIGKIDVYVKNNIINAQEILQLGNEKSLTAPYTSWVFFIDDMVTALWYHPCRYIFVHTETGEYQIVSEEIYPENKNEEFELISGLTGYESVDINETTTPVLETAEPNEHLYAVIICGEDNTCFWYSTSALYCTLIDVYGYTKDNIIIHYGEGYSTCTDHLNDLDGPPPSDDIDHSAYVDTIHTTFQYLKSRLGPEDQLLVVINAHGGGDSYGNSFACLPEEDLADSTLAEYVENIECSNMIFLLQNCFSGGFIDDLTDYQNYDVKCENRVIHTSCDYDEVAFLECHITAEIEDSVHIFRYGEMLYYWTSAARVNYPVTTQPWLNRCEVGSFPFADYPTMINHPPDYNPDDSLYSGNGDGIVQLGEAFDYMNNWNVWSPDTTIYYGGYPGYYCPYPLWPDVEDFPQQSYEIGFQDDLLSLYGFGGSITHSQTVSGNYTFATPLIIGPEVTLSFDNNSRVIINDSVSVTLYGRSQVEIINGSKFQFKPGSSLYGTEHTIWVDPSTEQKYDTWEEAYDAYLGAEDAIPGDKIVLNNSSSMIAEGVEENPVIITGVDSNSWDGFELTNSSQFYCDYSNISNIQHISAINSDLEIGNSTYENSGQISIMDSSHLLVQSSIIDSISACPIYCYESEIGVINNIIQNCLDNGIYVYLPSDSFNEISGNTITSNGSWGIQVIDAPIHCINNSITNNSSHGFVSYGTAGTPVLAGDTIANNGGIEIVGLHQWPDMTSLISYFGPNTVYSQDNGGADHYLLATSSQGNDCSGNNIDISDTTRFIPSFSAYIFDGEKPPEKILYEEGVVQITNGEYESAKLTMRDVVDNYPETKIAIGALQWLLYLENFSGNDYAGLRAYAETIDDVTYPNLERIKNKIITSTYMCEKDYLTSIDRLEDIIADPPSVEDSILALINEGYCYLKLAEQGDKATSIECSFKPRCFEEFQYVSQNMTRNLLDKAIPHPEPSTGEIETFALYQNYPNPCTHNTTISYAIPKSGKVSLRSIISKADW
ncbi:MAG: right-handed parallel beta-helix repeat-containing protein [Candidatus Cloacimonadia bacterium]